MTTELIHPEHQWIVVSSRPLPFMCVMWERQGQVSSPGQWPTWWFRHEMSGGGGCLVPISWLQSWDRCISKERSRAERRGLGLYADPVPPQQIQRMLNSLAHWERCFSGHIFPWWHLPVSLQEVEWWEEWEKQCSPAGPLHYGNPDADLQMPLSSNYLGLLLTLDTMVFMIQSWWNNSTFI